MKKASRFITSLYFNGLFLSVCTHLLTDNLPTRPYIFKIFHELFRGPNQHLFTTEIKYICHILIAINTRVKDGDYAIAMNDVFSRLFIPIFPLSLTNSAITLDATNPVFYCNRAAAHSRLSNYQLAADDCRMSLRYDPNYSKAYGRLGIAYSKLDRHDLALEAYRTAIQLDPSNADYQNNMAVTQQRVNEQLAAETTAATTAGGRPGPGPGPGGLPAGFPDLSGMDLGAALSNPDLMNMAQRMMTDPAMQDIMQSLQSGGGMESLMDA